LPKFKSKASCNSFSVTKSEILESLRISSFNVPRVVSILVNAAVGSVAAILANSAYSPVGLPFASLGTPTAFLMMSSTDIGSPFSSTPPISSSLIFLNKSSFTVFKYSVVTRPFILSFINATSLAIVLPSGALPSVLAIPSTTFFNAAT
jgi:hypothetical protein